MPHRIEKVNSLIKEELSMILLTTMDREHFKLLTITRVITSKDLSTSKVYISMPQGSFESFQLWLKPHIFRMQGEMNKRLSLYKTPRLVFLEDKTGDYVDRIEGLLQQIRSKK